MRWRPVALGGLAIAAALVSPLTREARGGQKAKPAAEARAGAVPRSVNLPQLRKTRTVSFPLNAPVQASWWNYCDAEGNIYLSYSAESAAPGPGPISLPGVGGLPITKLSLDSQTATRFAVQSLQGYDSIVRKAFTVDPEGNLYALFWARPSSLSGGETDVQQNVVVKFSDDGSIDSTLRIQDPPGGRIDAVNFAVFQDGSILVTGFERPASGSSLLPFTGIFDHLGRLVARLSLPADIAPTAPVPGMPGAGSTAAESGPAGPHKPPETRSAQNPMGMSRHSPMAIDLSSLASGPDDTVYLLRPTTPPILYTLASDGSLIHAVRIRGRAVEGARASNVSSAGRSSVWVEFYARVMGSKGYLEASYVFALTDIGTGRVTSAYRLPAGAHVFYACPGGPDDLEFVGPTKQRKLKVVEYAGR